MYKVGDKVSVRLPNGYTSEGIIERIYKNGSLGIREHSTCRHKHRALKAGADAYHVRCSEHVTIVATPELP